jgi:hypothetical protein
MPTSTAWWARCSPRWFPEVRAGSGSTVGAARSTRTTWVRLSSHWQWPVLLALTAIGAVACTHLLNFGLYHLRYRILNANSAASWSHIVATASLAAGAVVCITGARRARSQRATWIATAVVLGLFFIDEVSGLHARIDALNHGKLLYGPVLVVLAVSVWRLTIHTPQALSVRACAVLLAVSYLIHVLEPHNIAHSLGWSTDGWNFQVVVAIKEGTELAGVLLALSALAGAAFAIRSRSDTAVPCA